MSAEGIPVWADVCPRVLAEMDRQGVNASKLAEVTGLARSTVNGALFRAKDAQWGTVTRILTALGLTLDWVQPVGKSRERVQRKRDNRNRRRPADTAAG